MMKFDHIVMNPPYDGNLHLKVVQEAMKHSDDVVNLSPVRWLQDPLAEEKKGSDWKKFADIRQKTESLEVVKARSANEMFGAIFGMDLGIYHLTPKGGMSFDGLVDPICKKVLAKKAIFNKFENNKKDGWRVRVTTIGGGKSGGSGVRKAGLSHQKLLCFFNGMKDGKWWYEHYMRNQYSKTTEEITWSIPFRGETEATNFINVMNVTKFGQYYYDRMAVDVHVHPYMFISLDYTHPWDDAALYKYFGLTQEEISLIEEEMKEA